MCTDADHEDLIQNMLKFIESLSTFCAFWIALLLLRTVDLRSLQVLLAGRAGAGLVNLVQKPVQHCNTSSKKVANLIFPSC